MTKKQSPRHRRDDGVGASEVTVPAETAVIGTYQVTDYQRDGWYIVNWEGTRVTMGRGDNVTPGPCSMRERKQILQQEIAYFASSGYRITSETDTTAQMYRRRGFSFIWGLVLLVVVWPILAFLWLPLGAIGVIGQLIYYITAKRDQQVYISVDEVGQVSRA